MSILTQSEKNDKIWKKLYDIQCENIQICKNAKGYNYEYADLSHVISVLRPYFIKHEILVSQWPTYNSQDRTVTVLTRMVTNDGSQFLAHEYTVPALEANRGLTVIQAVSATTTMARRYSLMSIFNLSADDEDTDGAYPASSMATHIPISDYNSADKFRIRFMEKYEKIRMNDELNEQLIDWMKKKNKKRIDDIQGIDIKNDEQFINWLKGIE